jgi:predicted Zn finger-like uncharacterized protein
MTIITCPNCHSKFRFIQDVLTSKTIKMRCSICAHVFEYTLEPEASLEKEFDILLSSGPEMVEPSPEKDLSGNGFSQEITETPVEEPPVDQAPKQEVSEIQPESVMREIDSILGAGDEFAGEETLPAPLETKKRSAFTIALLAIAILAIGLGTMWIFRDKIPFLGKSHTQEKPTLLERGPFFTIDPDSLTQEVLTHEREGSVLLIRGKIKKITPKPVDSILIEARVYDKASRQLESRLAYAGIVPDTSEFTRQESRDIDALLTSQPASSGSMPSENIPFAVAFYGKSAREGASFQVEVKEFHWK